MSGKASTPDPALVKAVERQMRNWELARAQRPHLPARQDSSPPITEQVAQFVTLANNVGGGGSEVGHRLSEKLGWPIFDRQILKFMAGDDALRTRLYRSMDERDLGWFEETFRIFMRDEFRKNDYFHRLTEAVLCLTRLGPAIFMGRAADLILPRHRGLRVKVVTSLDYRIQSFARQGGVDFKEAAKDVERIDRERADFIERHFRIDINEPSRFDLLINVEQFSPEQATDLILLALRLRKVIA